MDTKMKVEKEWRRKEEYELKGWMTGKTKQDEKRKMQAREEMATCDSYAYA